MRQIIFAEGRNFARLMSVWRDKEILLVEGKATALGVRNDLLSNVNSVIRILCPPNNAFEKYDVILETVKKYAEGRLILLALGPTATVLPYDLAILGHRALDIGHCDADRFLYSKVLNLLVSVICELYKVRKKRERNEFQ